MPYWSETVLKTMAAVVPLGSWATLNGVAVIVLAQLSAGISVATGTRSTMVCSSISTPRPERAAAAEHGSDGAVADADLQALGDLLGGVSSMVSKNFSMSSSSAPAAASMSSARRVSTSSATAAGMAQETALPPLTS